MDNAEKYFLASVANGIEIADKCEIEEEGNICEEDLFISCLDDADFLPAACLYNKKLHKKLEKEYGVN